MSKKQKRNLQKLIAKKQQLQQVGQGSIVSFAETPALVQAKPESADLVAKPASSALPQNNTTHIGRELRKTAISIVLIVILLTAAIVFDRRTPYFSRFGDWLYTNLQLAS